MSLSIKLLFVMGVLMIMGSFLRMNSSTPLSSTRPITFIEGTAVSLPEFVYAEQVADRPLIVDLSTEDNACHITVSLVGLQGGGGDLTGRIERGECWGKAVSEGLVRASSSATSAGKSRLDRRIDVAVIK
jgi:hypothetical protein